ncbi:ATP-dependent dethiobiotin synthetase BioD [Gordonia namibiensis NBRC 108229]|uniref:ATP-dependent dethiobiotin synthetase BioD n=1 Tax=Gordonia namibiensis NBRC 108229 TaxID=1208314 RepID=K6X7V9_9ACTN|nr:dethiobiotin synthase [Gordonia namibiensis]GAC02182.1 ATP-dependent dethiobiotin synthetase BioD [Gordonia namibiensis NBRC 108229]
MSAPTPSTRGRVLAVTGTSTDVGKTVVTAALAAATHPSLPELRSAATHLSLPEVRGAIATSHEGPATPQPRATTVAVCKPVQTGVAPTEPGDLAEVSRLAGEVTTVEPYRYPEPLAPDTAARRAGMPLADPAVIVRAVDDLASTHDLTLVEGAGGVLVRLGESATILDIVAETLAPGTDDGVVIVVAPGLGALNHAELTVNAVRARGLRPAGLVIGWWPTDPDLAMRCNRSDLPRITGVPVVGVLPAGAAALDPAEFRRIAPTWFDPDWLATLADQPASLASTS